MELLKGTMGVGYPAYKGRKRLFRIRFLLTLILVAALCASTVGISVMGTSQKSSLKLMPKDIGEKESGESDQKVRQVFAQGTVAKRANSPASDPKTAAEGTQKADTAQTTFDGSVFIGNSRTQSLELFSLVRGADVFANRGIMVSDVDKKEFVQSGKAKLTILQALGKKHYKKVYIMLGINELGWAYEGVFIEKYGDMVDSIKNLQPNAKIYIQSILPVTADKSAKDKTFNNHKIDRYNELLKKLAQDKKITYLDVAGAVEQSDGTLPGDASKDGIHLLKPYCQKWVDYLKKNS